MHLYDRGGRALRHQRHRRRRHRPGGRHRARRQGARPRRHRVAFFGDGAANHGGFHEALNFAAVQRAPAVFVCENNLYATATPLSTRHAQPGDRHAGPPPTACRAWPSTATTCSRSGRRCSEAVERARRGDGPTLIEAKTYRTVGHHEGDPVIGTYRTQEEIDAWVKRDPIEHVPPAARRGLPRRDRRELGGDRGADRGGGRGGARLRAALARARPRDRAPRTSLPSRSTRPRRSRPAGARRDASAGLARRGARRHRRGDAGESGDPLLRRGHRRARRQLRPYQGSLGRSSGPSGWSTRRSPSRASPPPRSAPRRPGRARSPT